MFIQLYTGRMRGVLRWPQLENLWLNLDANDGWYLYEIGGELPESPMSAHRLEQAVDEIDAFLRAEQNADFCGAVYADDFSQPNLLKIYHPRKMGASCGSSGSTVLPKWTLSRQAPIDLIEWALEKDQKPAWWKHMFKVSSGA